MLGSLCSLSAALPSSSIDEERFGVHLEEIVFYGAKWDIIWPMAVEDHNQYV
jgi:hypothetical protein